MLKITKIQNIFDVWKEKESWIQLHKKLNNCPIIQEILLPSWFTYTYLLLSEKMTQGYLFLLCFTKRKLWSEEREVLRILNAKEGAVEVVWKAHRMFEN